ncbi:SAM-dependent methyltransferase [Dactylosporangium sp. NPDC005555]|uniref:SAM-dependent methyltransferase n=1 Tax=Dactylosporangium sp. NPDC005555 TaxID=3154889 RepID=UPI0033AB3D62
MQEVLDFTQPVALLLVAVLHFVDDDPLAYQAVGRLIAALPPGSFVAVKHAPSTRSRTPCASD